MTKARAGLGDAAFTTAWQEGRALHARGCGHRSAVVVPTEAVDAAPVGKSLTPATRHGLTPREAEVLQRCREGCSNRQIGERLYISERTARTHVQNILNKLDVNTRVGRRRLRRRAWPGLSSTSWLGLPVRRASQAHRRRDVLPTT